MDTPVAFAGIQRLRAASLHIADGVAELVHDRARERNPIGQELRQDYRQVLDIVEADASVRVLILRGEGHFCAGGDVREMLARADRPDTDADAAGAPERTRERIADANSWLHRLLNLRAVVIAAVDGAASGGGFSLALHADFVLATPQARFCMSFPRVGAVPDFGAHYLLPRIVGLGVARDLLLTGRTIGAQQARRAGIVHAVHPAQQLAEQSRAMARLLCNAPADVLAFSKRSLNQSFGSTYAAMGELEAQAQGRAMAAAYHQDAVRRFRDKRPLAYDWDRDAPPEPTDLP